MNFKKYVGFLVFGIFIFSSANASAVGLLDGILQTYQGATTGWMKVAQGYAYLIFAGLAPLSISFWAIQSLVFEGVDVSALIGKLMIKVFWLAFFFTIISLAPTWVPQVTDTFMVMGKGFAGSSGTVVTSPSQMMDIGVNVAHGVFNIWNVASSGSITSIGSNLLLALTLWASALCALAAFAMIALQLLVTQVELAIMAPIGVVMLGFFGAPATKSIAEKYPSYLVSIGVKLMFIFAMASLAPKIGDTAMTSITNAAASGAVPLAEVFGLAISLVIYGVLCLQIPAMASGMLSGSVSTSLGGIAGGALAAGGAVAGAAMAAGGAAAGAAKAGMGVGGGARSALDVLSTLSGGGGDIGGGGSPSGGFMDKAKGLGAEFGVNAPGSSGSGSPSPFGDEGNSIGGGANASTQPSQPKSKGAFGAGMEKMNQGLGGLGANEGQAGAGVDINSGNHGG